MKVRQEPYHDQPNDNKGSKIGVGLALELAIGVALGAGVSMVKDRFTPGMLFGAGSGMAIGLAIGVATDLRSKG